MQRRAPPCPTQTSKNRRHAAAISSEVSGAFVPPEVWLRFAGSAASFTWTFSCDASSVISEHHSAKTLFARPAFGPPRIRNAEMIQNNRRLGEIRGERRHFNGPSICLSRATATCEILCWSQHEYRRDAVFIEVREVPDLAGQ
jgi:hypothetical protein